MEYILDEILDKLSTSFPENKDFFMQNALIAKEALNYLKEYKKNILKLCKGVVFSGHDAYSYLVKDYKFNYYGSLITHNHAISSGISPHSVASVFAKSKYDHVCLLFDIGGSDKKLIENLRRNNPYVKISEFDADGIGIDYNLSITGYVNFFKKNIDLLEGCIC